MKRLLFVPLIVSVASCASIPPPSGPDPKLAKAIEGRVAGKPQSCIDLTDANGAEAFDGGILYNGSRRTVYVNNVPECRSFGSNDLMINRVYSSQLCRGDIVTFADRNSGIPGRSCILGDFTPYKKVG
jgi:hypothetical protein